VNLVPENEMKIFENLLWSMFHSYFIAKQRITKNVERCQSKKRTKNGNHLFYTAVPRNKDWNGRDFCQCCFRCQRKSGEQPGG